VKLALLYVLAKLGVGQFGIFTSWVIPLIFIIVPVDLHVFRRAIPKISRTTSSVAMSVTARWVRLDMAGYFFWLFGTSPLPILVLTVLGPKAAASFYIPLTISTAVDLLSLNVGNTVTAEISRDHGRVGRHPVQTLVRVWLLVVVGCVTIAVLAPHLLQLFGGHYRSHGGTALRLLVLAAPARSLMFFSNALARAQERGGRILVTQAIAAVGTLGLGLGLMPSMGVPGMAVAWLCSSYVAGAVALRWVLPVVIRRPTARH
jgi:O-antigen/teichoic acid export membrane protein